MADRGCFRYDLHVHTAEVSKCASSRAADIADMYKQEGYTGIVITDHFFTGNTTVPVDLPWEERVSRLKSGYENAKARGDEIGLDVFYGWEYTFLGTDLLTLGLDWDWLYRHPDVCEIGVTQYLNLVHESGGYIIHAHPFVEAPWIECIRLFPQYTDAVEVLNGSKSDFINERATEYAKAYNFTFSSGSDTHTIRVKRLCGIETKEKMNSLADLIETMKNREHNIFCYDRTNEVNSANR